MQRVNIPTVALIMPHDKGLSIGQQKDLAPPRTDNFHPGINTACVAAVSFPNENEKLSFVEKEEIEKTCRQMKDRSYKTLSIQCLVVVSPIIVSSLAHVQCSDTAVARDE